MKIHLPCLFGIESILKSELLDLGYEKISLSDGLVTVEIAAEDLAATVADLNFNLRTAERVLIEICSFFCTDFDRLFEETLALAWEDYLDKGFEIVVTGSSRKSKLFGISACQSLIKKAIVTRLIRAYGQDSKVLKEDSRLGQNRLSFAIVQDEVSIRLDTTGPGLHKRGYRPLSHSAPIRETLAAAILKLSFYERNLKNGEVLVDPFCGSGTFAIEAALMANQIAPGLKRHFAAEKFKLVGKPAFDRARELAKLKIKKQESLIFASDLDPVAIKNAKLNSERAGVNEFISFQQKDLRSYTLDSILAISPKKRVLITTNPPFGERLLEQKEADRLLIEIAKLCFRKGKIAPGLRLSVFTNQVELERIIKQKARKRRKLYHGMILCNLFHYF